MGWTLGNCSRFLILFISLFSLTVLSNGDAWSASGKAGPGGPFAVPVHSIDIPVLNSNKRESEIMTVFVVARSKLAVRTICYYMPRIIDSLIQSFHKSPLSKRAFEQLHLGDNDKRIFKAVHGATKRSKSIKGVHAIAGSQLSRKTVPWAKSLKIERCKEKKEDDKNKADKKH